LVTSGNKSPTQITSSIISPTQNTKDNQGNILETRLERRRTKELKVLEPNSQGLSYRKIAREVHVSLRDVAKYVQRILNKKESQSSTSIHDEIILEYRVKLLRSSVKDLNIERNNLMNEVDDLRALKYNLQIQVCTRQAKIDAVKRNLEYEKFSKEISNDVSVGRH
jgi:hypothetical protein